jgi:Ulp1 family protease
MRGRGWQNGQKRSVNAWTWQLQLLIVPSIQFDLFSKDVVLIPVNHNNAHWTAAVINFRHKRIESYDSMGMDRGIVFKV